MKPFGELLAGMRIIARGGDLGVPVRAVATDSRKVREGAAFIALKGAAHDGLDYLDEAAQRGAVAFVWDRPGVDPPSGAAWAQVEDAVEAVWRMGHSLADDPAASLKLIGVTGTNGKTTTAHLIRRIFERTGTPCAYVGTLGAELGGRRIDLGHTTPMAHDLASVLRDAVSAGCRAVSMEVSSHALELRRVEGCRFDAGVFTNLTPEHLDFHRDMDAYFAGKARLFDEVAEAGGKRFVGVINLDDEYGGRLCRRVRGRVVTYGATEGDVRATRPKVAAERVRFRLETPDGAADVSMPLGGRFNVSNGLAAAATAWAMGLAPDRIAGALERADPAPGRFESVPTGRDFSVIVDYAHSPDALAKLLATCRELAPTRLTVVFGCGGDRDRTKRPKMGALAAELADRVVVTSDNPRSEEPVAIIDEILAGIGADDRGRVEVEPDRRKAVVLAVRRAEPGELVVVAGKGHEDYQIIGDRRIHFDDREVVREALG